MEPGTGVPRIVGRDEWRRELEALRAQEKALTRQSDLVSAQRRRLPMVEITKPYRLEGEQGARSLVQLFEGRSQLVVYHFMFGEGWDAGCEGCSWVVDAMSHPAHLHARGVTLALVSRAPLADLLAYRARMGWELPWYSSHGSDFNEDFEATVDGEEEHRLSVFLRRGDRVFQTYATGRRGVEHLGSHWTYLDLTPYGRQETWEDSPDGWPQTEPYGWLRRHDEYEP
jgi:predicted dithiol-disulfide oxidoreductase (DUF899 family)